MDSREMSAAATSGETQGDPGGPPPAQKGGFGAFAHRFPWVIALVALVLGMGIGGLGSTETDGGGGAVTSGLQAQIEELQTENADLQEDREIYQEQAFEAEAEAERAARASRQAEKRSKRAETAAQNVGPGINVDMAEWDGLFQLSSATLDFSYGYGSVIGQLEYLGGGDCKLGYVELNATFFSGGQIVGTGLWNTTSLTQGSPVPAEVSGEADSPPDRADVVMTGADCA
jgi:hypothetical protein